MNDRELVLELVRRLNLAKVEVVDGVLLDENQYAEHENDNILIGPGTQGWHGHYVVFIFDGDKLVGHNVWSG